MRDVSPPKSPSFASLVQRFFTEYLSAITLFDVVICRFGEGRRAIDGWFTRVGFGTL